MDKISTLEVERRHLERAVMPILQRYEDGEIDLDDIIEELRPLRMRLYAINCRLKEANGNKVKTKEV